MTTSRSRVTSQLFLLLLLPLRLATDSASHGFRSKSSLCLRPKDVLPTSHILDNSVSLHVQRHHSPSKNRVGSPGICIYPLHSHLPQSVLTLSSERVLRNHDKHPRAEVYLPSLVWKAKAIVRGSLQQLQH